MEQDIQYVQGTTLRNEWQGLLQQLEGFADVTSASFVVEQDKEAFIRLRCKDEDLSRVDKALMHCLVIDPEYRECQAGQCFIQVRFRHWWREPVPFLLDPDGNARHYRYQHIDASQRPA